MKKDEKKHSKRWYKNPIIWMILFFPALAIVSGIYTMYLAIETNDGLVTDDYYKEGIGINKTLTKDKNALSKNISGLISINAANGHVQVKFSDQVNTELNSTLNFKLVHRTIPGFDQNNINLVKVEDTDLYTAQINALPNSGGRWQWEIQGSDWRINKNFTSMQNETIVHTFPQ